MALARPQLMEDERTGLVFEHLCTDDAQFLFEEIFVRQQYLGAGLITLPAGATVIDAGANIGLFSLFCCHWAPGARVHAIEPIPPLIAVLHNNVCASGFEPGAAAGGATRASVTIHECAVGERAKGSEVFSFFREAPAESTRHVGERTRQRARLCAAAKAAAAEPGQGTAMQRALTSAAVAASGDPSADRFECRVRTLSHLIREERLASIDLLKVDIEGDELAALAGVEDEHWHRIRQVAVEVHDVDERLHQITQLLERHGFAVTMEAQRPQVVDSFLMFVPKELDMFYVFGVRVK